MEQTTQPKVQPKTQPETEETLLDRTKKVVAELKVENDRKEALIKEEQKIRANALLGGRTETGQEMKTPEEVKKEQSQKLADEIIHAFK